MHYNGPVIRPHTDTDSLLVEVAVGCTHNKCTFCNFYKGYSFRMAPLSQIEEDLKEASRIEPRFKRIWACGGNPYAINTERLAEIGRLFKKYYPDALVSTYARVDDLLNKSVEEMRYIKENGIGDLMIGIETGDDEVLKKVNKGYTSEDILVGCKKLEAAGVTYRVIYLGGIAGKGNGVRAAQRTAEVLNKLHPYYMNLTTVSVLPGTELYEQRENGTFIEQNERERLEEFITLFSELKNDMRVNPAPNTTRFSFDIDLQSEKGVVIERMRRLQSMLTDEDEVRIQEYRNSMRGV